ncbi:MAG: antitoxin VapB family protein [Promethearchaeota archaeon]
MASHQISIRNDVYQKLKKIKQENESYSDTIERLLSNKGNVEDLKELYGISGEDELGFQYILNSSRKEIQKALETRFPLN